MTGSNCRSGDVVNLNELDVPILFAGTGGNNDEANGDTHSANESDNRLARLLPSAKKKKMGMATTITDRAPYEGFK